MAAVGLTSIGILLKGDVCSRRAHRMTAEFLMTERRMENIAAQC